MSLQVLLRKLHTFPQQNNMQSTAQVIQLQRNQGGHLGDEHTYGRDPLKGYELQQLRERDFWQMYPNMEEVFQNVVTGNASLFK